jgi:hypothetical protein
MTFVLRQRVNSWIEVVITYNTITVDDIGSGLS